MLNSDRATTMYAKQPLSEGQWWRTCAMNHSLFRAIAGLQTSEACGNNISDGTDAKTRFKWLGSTIMIYFSLDNVIELIVPASQRSPCYLPPMTKRPNRASCPPEAKPAPRVDSLKSASPRGPRHQASFSQADRHLQASVESASRNASQHALRGLLAGCRSSSSFIR